MKTNERAQFPRLPKPTYAIFHDWYDDSRRDMPGYPAGWTGEFFYLGTLEECSKEMARVSAIEPTWRFSIQKVLG
jgi:hypothetical protein